MGVLAEYVQKEAEQLKKEAHRREEAMKEWTSAIAELFRTLTVWVTEADAGHGLLRVNVSGGSLVQEPRLGLYEPDNLVISLGGRRIVVGARARYVVASIKPPGKSPRRADGMAEIKDGNMTDYYLFRLKEGDGDRWYIQSVARWNADPSDIDVEELDRDRFEAAILRIVK